MAIFLNISQFFLLFKLALLLPTVELTKFEISVEKKIGQSFLSFNVIGFSSFFVSFVVPEITTRDGKFVLCCLECEWGFGFHLIILGIFLFQSLQKQR